MKGDYFDQLDAARLDIFKRALDAANGNRAKTATLLDIGPNVVHRWCNKLGIPKDYGRNPRHGYRGDLDKESGPGDT